MQEQLFVISPSIKSQGSEFISSSPALVKGQEPKTLPSGADVECRKEWDSFLMQFFSEGPSEGSGEDSDEDSGHNYYHGAFAFLNAPLFTHFNTLLAMRVVQRVQKSDKAPVDEKQIYSRCSACKARPDATKATPPCCNDLKCGIAYLIELCGDEARYHAPPSQRLSAKATSAPVTTAEFQTQGLHPCGHKECQGEYDCIVVQFVAADAYYAYLKKPFEGLQAFVRAFFDVALLQQVVRRVQKSDEVPVEEKEIYSRCSACNALPALSYSTSDQGAAITEAKEMTPPCCNDLKCSIAHMIYVWGRKDLYNVPFPKHLSAKVASAPVTAVEPQAQDFPDCNHKECRGEPRCILFLFFVKSTWYSMADKPFEGLQAHMRAFLNMLLTVKIVPRAGEPDEAPVDGKKVDLAGSAPKSIS